MHLTGMDPMTPSRTTRRTASFAGTLRMAVLLLPTLVLPALTMWACDSGPTAPTPMGSVGGGATGGGVTSVPAPPSPETTPQPTPTPTPTPAAEARFVAVFDAFWSARTHPTDFPSNPHFSPLVGATHNSTVSFWSVGARASDGIRRMAEQGLTNPLDVDIRASIAARASHQLLQGGGIGTSPGQVSLEFDATIDHPLVTLVSMIAPSPDWFVGVSALPLMRDGQWVDEVRVELFPYDAGTDNGVTYTSPDRENAPRGLIERIDGRPFSVGGEVAPVGMFTFKRLR